MKKDKPKHFVYNRPMFSDKEASGNLMLTAVRRRIDYTDHIIPDDMYIKSVEMYVNQG